MQTKLFFLFIFSFFTACAPGPPSIAFPPIVGIWIWWLVPIGIFLICAFIWKDYKRNKDENILSILKNIEDKIKSLEERIEKIENKK